MAPQVEIFVLCGKIKTKKPLLGKGLNDDSDWARTSDLYPVKVSVKSPVSQSVSQTLVYRR